MPHDLLELFRFNQKVMYNLLFEKDWKTIGVFSKDPKLMGAQPGAIAVLHTWDQQLGFHPHVHMIVPAGGIDKHGCWKSTKQEGDFLFDDKQLSEIFSARFVRKLRWYSHRVAISNHRILKITRTHVTFSWLNRKAGYRKETKRITGVEFLELFLEHIVPPSFQRIRHMGYLSNRNKRESIEKIREQLLRDYVNPPTGTPKGFSNVIYSQYLCQRTQEPRPISICPISRKPIENTIVNTLFISTIP